MSCHDAAVPPTFSSIITGTAKDSLPTGDRHNYGLVWFARDSSSMLCFRICLNISCNFPHVAKVWTNLWWKAACWYATSVGPRFLYPVYMEKQVLSFVSPLKGYALHQSFIQAFRRQTYTNRFTSTITYSKMAKPQVSFTSLSKKYPSVFSVSPLNLSK